jgi:hypothetical protein
VVAASGILTIYLVSVVEVHSIAGIPRAPVQLLVRIQFAAGPYLSKVAHGCLAAMIDAWTDYHQFQPPTFA